MMPNPKKVIEVQTLLSEDAVFTGNLTLQGTAKIDGKFEGDIVSRQDVVVGEKAVINGNLTCRNAIVSGHVTGDILSSGQISLTATAVLYGNITYEALVIDEGAVFSGNCTLSKKEDLSVPATPIEE